MPHIHELIDYTADVYVVYEDKVLIRKHDKYDLWCAVGGHIELGETPEQAAVREVKEEVGLDVTLCDSHMSYRGAHAGQTELIPPLFLNIHAINDTHRHISFVYAARATSGDITPENETDEWRWFTRAELDADETLRDHVKVYAARALDVCTS